MLTVKTDSPFYTGILESQMGTGESGEFLVYFMLIAEQTHRLVDLITLTMHGKCVASRKGRRLIKRYWCRLETVSGCGPPDCGGRSFLQRICLLKRVCSLTPLSIPLSVRLSLSFSLSLFDLSLSWGQSTFMQYEGCQTLSIIARIGSYMWLLLLVRSVYA